MERRQKLRLLATYMIVAIIVNLIGRISSLSVVVNEEECVYEYVIYEGDTVSGNFVVVDHDVFWGSDHPGIDFTVSMHIVCNFTRSNCYWLILTASGWLFFWNFFSFMVFIQLRVIGMELFPVWFKKTILSLLKLRKILKKPLRF